MRIEYIAIVGLLINLGGAIPYIRNTLKGNTQPNRVSYFLWAAIPMIGIAAAWSEGVTWALIPVFSASFIPFLIFLASFWDKRAYWKLQKFDYLCGLLSLLALLLWYLTSNAILAILFAIVADTFASFPTLVKLWKHPESETRVTYVCGFLSGTLGLAALGVWTVAEVAFPIYVFFMNTSLAVSAYSSFFKSPLRR